MLVIHCCVTNHPKLGSLEYGHTDRWVKNLEALFLVFWPRVSYQVAITVLAGAGHTPSSLPRSSEDLFLWTDAWRAESPLLAVAQGSSSVPRHEGLCMGELTTWQLAALQETRERIRRGPLR